MAGRPPAAHAPVQLGAATGCTCGWIPPLVWRSEKRFIIARREHVAPFRTVCSVCGDPLTTENRTTTGALQCRDCRLIYEREWQARNPARYARRRYSHHLKRKFGISIEDYEKLLAAQDGVCRICKDPPGFGERGRLHVDHDHSDGRIRGLLCMNCNQGLGQFRDDVALLSAAVAYLEEV